MTQSGDPTGSPSDENAMVERLFRTLKEDFGIRGFFLFQQHKPQLRKKSIPTTVYGHMLRWVILPLTRRTRGQDPYR